MCYPSLQYHLAKNLEIALLFFKFLFKIGFLIEPTCLFITEAFAEGPRVVDTAYTHTPAIQRRVDVGLAEFSQDHVADILVERLRVS